MLLPIVVILSSSTREIRKVVTTRLRRRKGLRYVAREGKGKVVDRGTKYSKIFIYIPKSVFEDTSFPFKVGEDVLVRIEGDKLVVSKLERGKKVINQS